MVKEVQFTTIQRVLDNLKDDENMQSLTLEQAVRHTIRFIGKHGYPKLYIDKMADVEIHEFRGVLPCDLISIVQVKDTDTGICLRSMTDNFTPGWPSGKAEVTVELSFKTQGRIIYTSFPEGKVTVAYKSIPVDDDGYPMLVDNESYLDALEAYITMVVLRSRFRAGKVQANVYQDAQQVYAVAARELMTEMTTPSLSEMESISRMMTTMIPQVKHFDNGFKDEGNREYLRRH
jgi:hypothetical protein